MNEDHGDAFGPISEKDPMGFTDMFPSETRGDGLMRKNNAETGAAQGRGGTKRKVRCQQCGFLVDINAVDHSGGSFDGNGAGGAVTTVTDSGTMLSGESVNAGHYYNVGDSGYDSSAPTTEKTRYQGSQAVKKGAGCPFCFSKNASRVTNYVQAPVPRPKIGF